MAKVRLISKIQAALVLTLGVSFVLFSGHARAQVITVKIPEVVGIGVFDQRAEREDPDFYAIVTIDGERSRTAPILNQVRSTPGWTFEHHPTRRNVPILIELREVDFRNPRSLIGDNTPSIRADINPENGNRRLRFMLDSRECILTDQRNRTVSGNVTDTHCEFSLSRTGNNPRLGARVGLTVYVDR